MIKTRSHGYGAGLRQFLVDIKQMYRGIGNMVLGSMTAYIGVLEKNTEAPVRYKKTDWREDPKVDC